MSELYWLTRPQSNGIYETKRLFAYCNGSLINDEVNLKKKKEADRWSNEQMALITELMEREWLEREETGTLKGRGLQKNNIYS